MNFSFALREVLLVLSWLDLRLTSPVIPHSLLGSWIAKWWHHRQMRKMAGCNEVALCYFSSQTYS